MGMHNGREAAWRDRCADLDLNVGLNEDTTAAGVNRVGLNQKRRRGKRRRQRQDAHDHRDRRLCGQVRRAVQLGLADCGDPDLQAVVVEAVAPAARSACLEVSVSVSVDRAPEDLAARLTAVTGRLRADVARMIHRKKTPNLRFRWVAPGGQEVGDDL